MGAPGTKNELFKKKVGESLDRLEISFVKFAIKGQIKRAKRRSILLTIDTVWGVRSSYFHQSTTQL